MTDLRDLLDLAAGDAPPAAPLADIHRRGRALHRRRRFLEAACLAAVAILGVTVGRLPTPPPEPAAPRPATVRTGQLSPGVHRASELKPPVTFTVPENGMVWRVALVTRSSLVLASDHLGVLVSLQHWTGVYPPSTAVDTQQVTAPVPADLIGWLTQHPELRAAAPPERTSLAGRAARRLTFTINPDRRVTSGPAVGCTDPADCVTLAETPDNTVTVPRGGTVTVTATDDTASGLILTVMIPDENYAIAFASVEPLLDSLTRP